MYSSPHRLEKSQSRLGTINATKRDGSEVELGSIVLELAGLGHLGGANLMLVVVELGRREVCLGWRSFGLHEFLFRLESTNVVVVDGLVVLEEYSLGHIVVQSHHEVKLHRNGVVHNGSSQGNLHLLEVLVDGLGSLDGVLQLASKLFRVGWRHELLPQSSLRLGPTHVVGL